MPSRKSNELMAKAIADQATRVAPKLMSDKQALEYIRGRLPELVDKLMELALVDKDRVAIMNLIDRVLGKPHEHVELEQQGEFHLNISVRDGKEVK